MKKSVLIVLLTAFFAVPQSCENSYSIYSGKDRVNFAFNSTEPPYNTVTTSGRFISIRCKGTDLIVTDADKKETSRPMSEQEIRYCSFGAAGLIVGTPALEGQVYAYDLACPICDDYLSKLSRLNFNTSGIAECPSCHSKFELNNTGFVRSAGDKDKSRPLYRYPVSQNGQMISIVN